jgi:hypothetical protein
MATSDDYFPSQVSNFCTSIWLHLPKVIIKWKALLTHNKIINSAALLMKSLCHKTQDAVFNSLQAVKNIG